MYYTGSTDNNSCNLIQISGLNFINSAYDNNSKQSGYVSAAIIKRASSGIPCYTIISTDINNTFLCSNEIVSFNIRLLNAFNLLNTGSFGASTLLFQITGIK